MNHCYTFQQPDLMAAVQVLHWKKKLLLQQLWQYLNQTNEAKSCNLTPNIPELHIFMEDLLVWP